MNKKAEKFQAMLDELKIAAFHSDELTDEYHTIAFRSQMEIQSQFLPMMVLLDDSIYSIVRIFIAAKVVSDEDKSDIAKYLNDFNKKFKVFKYYISDAGDIVLDCCITADDDHFDPNLVRAVIDVVLRHLNEVYKDIMKEVWNNK